MWIVRCLQMLVYIPDTVASVVRWSCRDVGLGGGDRGGGRVGHARETGPFVTGNPGYSNLLNGLDPCAGDDV